jgi:hypothetical protein
MPGRVRPQKWFEVKPKELLTIRAALFQQIETADRLARKLAIPELTEVIAEIGEEARQVFPPPCVT